MPVTDRIVDFFAERGVFLDPKALDHVRQQPEPTQYAEHILDAFLEPPFHLTLQRLLEAESLLPPRVQRPLPVRLATPSTPLRPLAVPITPTPRVVLAADYASEVRVLRDTSGSLGASGQIKDFVDYFNDRLTTLGRLLRRRREVANAIPIHRALEAPQDVQLIGMVSDVSKRSKSGHRFLELEDATGTVTILVPQSRPELMALSDTLLTDEVIGVVAKSTKDRTLLVADQLVRPDVPFQADQKRTDVPICAAVLSDIHLGSTTFLQDPFRRMIRWLHGEQGPERERTTARQIKYLVLPGDIVDGVGVYPGQEDSLAIPEYLEQYRTLAREFEALPRHVSLVVLPGNHDASRPNEPQPALDKEIRSYFGSLDATFVSNPSLFSLHGVTFLGYHGYSMVDFVTHVPNQALDRPLDIMKLMLQCRHLAPAYGGKTPVSPEAHDRLVIDTVPDVFVTGHVHVAAAERYRGVTLINGGTWQSQTSFQKMHNLVPTPAVMPIVNLSTLNATKVDFSVAA